MSIIYIIYSQKNVNNLIIINNCMIKEIFVSKLFNQNSSKLLIIYIKLISFILMPLQLERIVHRIFV